MSIGKGFQEAGMVDTEEKQEKGGSLMFVGLALWVAGLLVLFYMPAGIRLGHLRMFEGIVIVLGALGAVLMGRGWRMRRGG
jgi:hypothetical protein